MVTFIIALVFLALSIAATRIKRTWLGRMLIVLSVISIFVFPIVMVIPMITVDDNGEPGYVDTTDIVLFAVSIVLLIPTLIVARRAVNRQTLVYYIDGHKIEACVTARICRLLVDGDVKTEASASMARKKPLTADINGKIASVKISSGPVQYRILTVYNGVEIKASEDTVVPSE
ncbi:MAG: hypothetical protein LBM78_02360 [Clostridiales bacterium]|nr:hypothetical protein [Clostridiales bacterium]